MTILVSIHSRFRMWTMPVECVDALRRQFPGDTFHARNDDDARGMIADAEIALSSHITPDQLAAARRLQWVHSPAAGVGHMLYPAMVERPLVMTNGRGTSADTIAEHVLAVVLALFRRLPLAVTRQAARVWAQDEMSAPPGHNRTIAGSRVLVIGLGGIGAATAVRLHALGATVTGVRRRPDAPAVPGVAAVHPPTDLRKLLPGADVVVVAAPETGDTRDLIGAPELERLKPGAILVNVSRGGLVDEEALVRALRAGRLGGAALDVFRGEPLGPDDPLWDVPGLLITPHTAGFRNDHWDAVVELFGENRRRFAAGTPLVNVVDKRAGY